MNSETFATLTAVSGDVGGASRRMRNVGTNMSAIACWFSNDLKAKRGKNSPRQRLI